MQYSHIGVCDVPHFPDCRTISNLEKRSEVDVFDAEIAYVMHEAKMVVFWIQLTKNAVL